MRTLGLGLVVAVIASCGSARVISHSPAGGIIELKGDQKKAMEQAIQTMHDQCGPGNFTIKEPEEATTTRVYYVCKQPRAVP